MDAVTPPEIPVKPPTRRRLKFNNATTAGYLLLVATSFGWGLNWPVTKRLLAEVPPLTARGLSGVLGAALLAILAIVLRKNLRVPRDQWPRLVLLSVLNVTSWMALMGIALTYLPASEAAVMAYTMPVWAAALAWPILGERLTLLRIAAMALAIAALVVLMGGTGITDIGGKWPGIVLALTGALAFAVGTVFAKRWPLQLPSLTSAVWQIGIGCFPVALAGSFVEQANFADLSPLGWSLFVYSTVIQFCVAYVCWFAALERLPASVAAIGTMLVPVIGVVASAAALGEPLGPTKIAALVLTLVGVTLASRS